MKKKQLRDFWIKYEPGAVLKDEGLKCCSFAAKGLWWWMWNHAHQNTVRPVGTLTGDLTALKNMLGASEQELGPLIQELERNKVFSRGSDKEFDGHGLPQDDIVSRRTYTEGLAATRRREGNSRGGTKSRKPKLEKQVNGKSTASQKDTATTDTSSTCMNGVTSQSQVKGNRVQSLEFIREDLLSNKHSTGGCVSFLKFEEKFRAQWDSLAARCNVKSVYRWTEARRKKLKTRSGEKSWVEDYQSALAEIPNRPFLVGNNDSGWSCDVDWFMRPGSVNKILEGSYEGSAKVDKNQRKLPQWLLDGKRGETKC